MEGKWVLLDGCRVKDSLQRGGWNENYFGASSKCRLPRWRREKEPTGPHEQPTHQVLLRQGAGWAGALGLCMEFRLVRGKDALAAREQEVLGSRQKQLDGSWN